MTRPAGPLRSALRSETRRSVSNSLVGLVFSFGSGVLSARLLGPADRGVLTLTLAIVTTAGVVSSLGSTVALRVHLGSDRRASIRAYLRLSLLLSLLQALLVTAAVLVLVRLLHTGRPVLPVVVWGALVGLSTFAAQQAFDALNAIGRIGTSALANGLGAAVTLVVLVVATRLHLGLLVALLGYAAGAAVAAGLAVTAFRRDPVARSLDDGPGSPAFLLTRGVRLLSLNLGQALALKLDHYVVGYFSGAAATGIYAVAAAHVAPTQVSSMAVGQIGLHAASQRTLSAQRLVRLLLLSTGMAAAAGVLVWTVTPWFIPLVFGEDFRASVPVVRVLALGQVALAPYLLASRVLAGRGRSLLASASGLVLLGALAVALLLLTPAYGPVGAAWATTSGFAAASLWTVGALVLGSRATPDRGYDAVVASEPTQRHQA